MSWVLPAGGKSCGGAPGVRIIAAMERIADKCVVLLACLSLVALAGAVDAVRVVALLVAVGAGACFELSHGRRPAAAATVCCVTCALAALVPGAWVALPLACYDLPRVRSRWVLVVAPCCVAWAWAAGVPATTAAVLLALVACSMVLSWRCGRSVGLERELHGLQDDLQDKVIDLREKNRELEDARAYESHAAALAERTRIAREIHDSVGHQLTRLVLEVEALKVVHRDDATAVEELGELSDGLREALTNAARHAHATHATVHATGLPGIWQLRVENDGDVPEDVAGLEERGMGLRGMRERVEGLGGTLLVQSDGRRFSVFASIPRKGQA